MRSTSEGRRKGMHVQVPFNLGPAKEGKDKAGGVAGVWDVVVHPDTVKLIGEKVAVRDLLAEMVRKLGALRV